MVIRVVLSSLLLLPIYSIYAQANIRIDCHPEEGASQENCEARGCIWKEVADFEPVGTPWCFMKSEEMGYIANPTANLNEWSLVKNSGPRTPWGSDLPSLKFSYKDIGDSVIRIRIEDNQKRFEASDFVDFPRRTETTTESLLVKVRNDSDPFSFAVQRKNGLTLFDTSIGGLIFADKFIQIATSLPSKNMYGWGENVHQEIKHDFTRYTTWGMFARDEGPNSQGLDTKNLYGVHPFYMMMEPNGQAHGVLILNANAQEVTTIPAPGFVYRTIGGILDIYFFPGPSPAEVVRQYTAFIGRPMLPPYWALGYQLCRWGYHSLQDMKDRVAAVRSYQIPFDVAYADIDYMERYKDFTVGSSWAEFGDYVKQMHDWGMHNILIFDPAIQANYDSFQRGLDNGASFIEWERSDEVPRSVQDLYPLAKDTKILLAVVWPDQHVAFPDFLDPTNKTQQWWIDEFKRYHDAIPFDGAWIDMNEPASFGTNEDHPFFYDDPDHPKIEQLRCPTSGPDADWDMPPYQTHAVFRFGGEAILATKTLCMRAVQGKGGELRMYDTHSLYGWSESRATQTAVHEATGKRGVVISRSTYPSSGRYSGHWLGDNSATWQDLRTAVIGAQEFNLFGIPYVGSDVCGFNGVSNEELCLRWQQLGSFHSFFRNHNAKDNPYQDPAVWPSVATATKKANEFRYSMLPYLYSLHYAASLKGDTVVRPMFFEFPHDSETLGLSEQFMWGPSILVIPALYQGQTEVEGYIPLGDTPSTFYSLYDYSYGQRTPVGRFLFPAPTTYNTPTFVKSGYIIPRSPPALTTVSSRLLNFNLLIVPNDPDGSYNERTASGILYWDDGDSVVEDITKNPHTETAFNYVFSTTGVANLTLSVAPAQAPSQPRLEFLEIFDFPSTPSYSSFTLDGKVLSINTQKSKYSPVTRILTVSFGTPIDFSSAGVQTISWNSAV